MEIKQHATEHPMGQRRNQENNNKKRYLEKKGNKKTMYQNFWHIAKTIVRGKFIVINVYNKKKDLK